MTAEHDSWEERQMDAWREREDDALNAEAAQRDAIAERYHAELLDLQREAELDAEQAAYEALHFIGPERPRDIYDDLALAAERWPHYGLIEDDDIPF